MAWPAIAVPSFGTQCEVIFPQVRTEFEGNYVQSRPRGTREVRRWTLKWNAMKEADYGMLETYYLANQGTVITWAEPVTSTSYDVRFAGNSLDSYHIDKGVRSVSVVLEEA